MTSAIECQKSVLNSRKTPKKKRKVILFEHKYTTDFFSKKFHLITYQGNHLSSLGGGGGGRGLTGSLCLSRTQILPCN